MKPAARDAWREGLIVACAMFVWLAATAWVRPLLLPDEGRYVGVAWEMVRSGDWLTPTLNGLPYFHKPPLFYWITAASIQWLGPTAFSGRIASILGGCLAAVSLYAFLRRWAGTQTARYTAFALAAQPMFFVGSQFANLDMLVAGCITATILLLAHAVLVAEAGAPARWPAVAAYGTAALGVLAKGLIGAVLPALVVLAWLAGRRRLGSLRAGLSLPGLVLFAAVALPWFVAMQARHPEFLDYFFVVQQFKRYSTAGFNSQHPFWFYPVALAVLGLPWLPWVARPLARPRLADPERGAIHALMLWWLIVIVAFFSVPKSKLVGYMLPVVPPLAYFAAEGLRIARAPAASALRRWWGSAAAAVSACLVGIVAFAVVRPNSTVDVGLALRAQRQPSEPVFMVDRYDFDVPFYGRLERPVTVVAQWSDPSLVGPDSWGRELADAARFASPTARAVLAEPASLPATLCGSSVSWIVAPRTAVKHHPLLGALKPVAASRDALLWRVDPSQPAAASALGCVQMPSDVPAGTSPPPGPVAAGPEAGRSVDPSIAAGQRRVLR